MSFSQDEGYIPLTFDEFMSGIRLGINAQFGTTYTAESFVGTNWYKYFYSLVQKALVNETKAAEVFAKLQQYIAQTNLRIQRPSVSHPGIIETFESAGYTVSVKPIVEADAGKLSVCVLADAADPDYAETKLDICSKLKDYSVGGCVTMGTEVETIVLSNGQGFDFKFYLPTLKPVIFRVTIYTSENTLLTIPNDEDIRQVVYENINEKYQLGWNFEPQRYFTQTDAPYAESVLLEYSLNAGGLWSSLVYDADFKDLFTYGLDDIAVSVDP